MTDERVTNSPLQAADHRALNELFKADPETITAEELERMIEYYREGRKEFVKQETKNQKTGAKSTKRDIDSKKSAKDLLSDLGL